MRKILSIVFLSAALVGCENGKKQSSTSNIAKELPEEQTAIQGIQFFSNEIDFDSIVEKFYEATDNPQWEKDMIAQYPYIYKGFGFDRLKGIFSRKGQLVGVHLSAMNSESRRSYLPENMNALEKAMNTEYGKYIDAHQTPSENDIKKKGEYTYKLWAKGNKYALMSFSSEENSDNLFINLYIYRKDQIANQQTNRSIDDDLDSLKLFL